MFKYMNEIPDSELLRTAKADKFAPLTIRHLRAGRVAAVLPQP